MLTASPQKEVGLYALYSDFKEVVHTCPQNLQCVQLVDNKYFSTEMLTTWIKKEE